MHRLETQTAQLSLPSKNKSRTMVESLLLVQSRYKQNQFNLDVNTAITNNSFQFLCKQEYLDLKYHNHTSFEIDRENAGFASIHLTLHYSLFGFEQLYYSQICDKTLFCSSFNRFLFVYKCTKTQDNFLCLVCIILCNLLANEMIKTHAQHIMDCYIANQRII